MLPETLGIAICHSPMFVKQNAHIRPEMKDWDKDGKI
jgi:hypothetical protein